MRSVLFIILHSPFEKSMVSRMEMVAGDAPKGVLLFEDGIYYATHPVFREALLKKGIKIYASETGTRARGCETGIPDVEFVDYDRAVDLIMEEYDTSITCVCSDTHVPEV